jgi:hypothetical protein
LHMIYDLNAKLEKLRTGQKLNGEQALEREILMIAKKLQEGSLDDRPMKRIKKSTPLASEDESEMPAEKSSEADKPTQEDSEKKDTEEKPAEKEKKSDDS